MCETKAQATKEGKALLKKMKGKGWKLNVWETMGWHYCVHLDHISVWANTYRVGTLYSCLMGNCWNSGRLEWCDTFHSKDPNKAVAHMVRMARANVVDLDEIVTKTEEAIWSNSSPLYKPTQKRHK